MSEQGSQEWLAERLGVFTGSAAGSIMGGAVAQETLLLEKVGEVLTGEPAKKFKGNAATDRGHELEPQAAQLWSFLHGINVSESGLVYWDQSPLIAASPDRLTADGGGLEIKSLCPRDHIRAMLKGPDKKYEHQVWWCMMATGADYWYYVGYNPDLPDPADYYEKRYERDDKVIKKYEDAAWSFIERLDDTFKKIGVEL